MQLRISSIKCIIILIALSSTTISCQKYLSEKPDKSLTIPSSVSQLQGVLDQATMYSNYPTAGVIADDNSYFTFANWSALDLNSRNNYVWDANTDLTTDWQTAYTRILNANVVLSVIDTLTDVSASTASRGNVKGNALFYRASNFFALAQLFAPQYSSKTASTGYGIPLKSSPAAEDVTVRSTVQETYDQMIGDLKEAANLLPSNIQYATRASKPAAYAQLARTYLVMGKYDSAFKYADLCLQLYSTLLDYNNTSDANLTATAPFKVLNPEVIFHCISRSNSAVFTRQFVDSTLYSSYAADDLRKTAFYKANTGTSLGTYTFKGNYNASTSILFDGIATDEVYLIRAECNARMGNAQAAMTDLNILMKKRWKSSTFVSLTAADATDALNKVLTERRKEIVYRPTLRWSDIRRLNLEASYAKTLNRNLNGQLYALPVDDPRYTFLIPASVVSISGIIQNPR